ncbi:MAG: lactonase family protein [Kofleriaceae bacterium]
MRFALLALAACSGGASGSVDAMGDGKPAPDAAIDAALPAHATVYIGGYSSTIGHYDFDRATGALTSVDKVTAFATSPSFLAMTSTHLYAVGEDNSKVGAYTIGADGALTFINSVASGGSGPAFVSVDHGGKFVLVANYTDGHIAVMPVRGDGGVNAAIAMPLAGMNAHMFITDPANHFAFVPCLGSDYIAQYTFDPVTGAIAANAPATVASASGAGPRHIAFGPNGNVYVVDETKSTLMTFHYDAASGTLGMPVQTISTRAMSATGTNTGAEVVVHPNGTFVYASNRGDDEVAVFSIAGDGTLTRTGAVATDATPRSFAIDASGAWMLVAAQGGNTVAVFAIDPATGMATATGTKITFTQPSFVGFGS